MICEDCWEEAFMLAACNQDKSQTEYYHELLDTRAHIEHVGADGKKEQG